MFNADRTQVTVSEAMDPSCGGVRPVVVGQPAFDAQGLVLRIPVAIRNGGPDPLEDPARVWSAESLLKVLQTDGIIAGTETPLVFANAARSPQRIIGRASVSSRTEW